LKGTSRFLVWAYAWGFFIFQHAPNSSISIYFIAILAQENRR
jgi:hypothetical protein